uniref:Ferric oxidoreductase domain-containing protein n=1 Tax=Pyricularia oryzae (strain P131) TaxID=1143193 RepID=L7JNM8_PYRO1
MFWDIVYWDIVCRDTGTQIPCRQHGRFYLASGHSYYTTRYECFLFLSVLTANIAAITIGVDDRRKFVERTGMVAVINIVPLFLGAQMSVVASNFSVKLGSNARLHRWLGTAAIMEGVLHAATSLSMKKPEPSKREEIAGFLVSHP